MDQKKIGNFLRDLRKSNGFTQEQVAERLGTSSRTISRWETGAYMPDISLLVTIAEMYDVDVREIIDGERKKENMNSEVKEVAVKMADYSTMEKKNMLKWIKLMSIASFIVSLCVIVLNWIRTFGVMKTATTDMAGKIFFAKCMDANSILAYILLAFSVAVMLYASGKLKQIEQSKVGATVIKIIVVVAVGLAVFAMIQAFGGNNYYFIDVNSIIG
ncbi:MAG: helix-turn-helix domain-containing protein [Lachnospiraceae bacterium]|nr:helix-turn-helix domain-containing protein [Lachnospiraceae bacterium]